MQPWCEHWNIKISVDKTQFIHLSLQLRLVEAHLTLKGRHIVFVNKVKYHGVIFIEKVQGEYI
jgi:hypothetical protein